jgi:exopolysaccharide biosynthesis operon protein EpsL
MQKLSVKVILAWCLILISVNSAAEGIVDIKPHVSTSVNYDDNVFRLSSTNSDTSDVVKRLEIGVDVNLKLSRQLFSLSAEIDKTKYNRFDLLDNTGKSTKLAWNWRLGNDLYGEVSSSESESLAGFNEIRDAVKNFRTSNRQRLNINWDFHPDWTFYATRDYAKLENDQLRFASLDRNDNTTEAGIRYQNTSTTQLGLAYRDTESKFPNRSGFTQFLFGDESTQQEIITTAAWAPTPKTRISARLSHISLKRENLPQRDFEGIGQRWNLDHMLTGKTTVNLSAYQEVYPVDEVESTYVKTKGFSINPGWDATSKITLRGGIGYEERDYLGSAGAVGDEDRNEESKFANLSLSYAPTYKSLLQLQYQGEKRSSSVEGIGYKFNTINFLIKYDF